jgi:hypothetical protein
MARALFPLPPHEARTPSVDKMDWTGICQIGKGTGSDQRRQAGAA